MLKEIIALLENAKHTTEHAKCECRICNNVDQAIAILKEQPPAGDEIAWHIFQGEQNE